LFFKGPSKPASSKDYLNPKRVVVAVFENLTGVDLLHLNRPRETIDVYEQFGEKSWSFFWGDSVRIDVHASAHHMLGDFQRELELAKKGQEIYPDDLYLLCIEARALAALGKTDEVKKVIDKSLITPSSLGTPGWVMREAALELRAVELLRESFAQGLVYTTYVPRDINFEPIKDYPPFKEFIRPKR
jgi:tetratricopeptide (TPR) repeat protein